MSDGPEHLLMDASLNYFTCTLGEAASRNLHSSPPWTTVNQLIDLQAVQYSSCPAVGFFDGSTSYVVYSYRELRDRTLQAAQALKWRVNQKSRTVALLCASGRDFLFAWLGLIRMGFIVLLIAPEVPVNGIASLLRESMALTLLHDDKHTKLAHSAIDTLTENSGISFKTAFVPRYAEIVSKPSSYHRVYSSTSSPAYIHHTSGTSTGKPKSIYISHHGAVGALPVFHDPGPTRKATFTTTPLYHGGPADCFRAWTSSSLIWLYPGVQDRPITTENVMKAIGITGAFCRDQRNRSVELEASVRYFTAVPYVVEGLAARQDGVEMLRSMELVGVGGAALSKSLGDQLVSQDVNLISRYGSAECGFIMSSRRDYNKDKGWQYLRQYPTPTLAFERQADGLAELVLKDWPFMAKTNRDDGSYATSDLFMSDDSGSRWKYHSRADSQLTLSTGKKFDPTPTEDQINAAFRSLKLLRDSYIFGDDRPSPGVLLFRGSGAEGISDGDLTDKVWQIVAEENAKSAPHARISRSMLVILPTDSAPLQKTNKGTIIRRRAEEDFRDQISDAYSRNEDGKGVKMPLDEASIKANVRRLVEDRVPGFEESTEDAFTKDLYSVGADSIACMEIRSSLQRDYGQALGITLSPNLVYECGSIENLVKHIMNLASGADSDMTDRSDLMNTYKDKYTNILRHYKHTGSAVSLDGHIQQSTDQEREIVILTGVTGTLGVWILHTLRSLDNVDEIHCLIRGADQDSAEQRLAKALIHKRLPGIQGSKAKIYCHPCKLHDQDRRLGLSQEVYTRLEQHTTLIVHAAWTVNFNLPLKHFESHFQGLANLILLATASSKTLPPRFLFCSSTASVLGCKSPQWIPECISLIAEDASAIGYAESKWVAEAICDAAHKETRLAGRLSVLRIGQLCGDEASGIWNATEAWPLMLSSTEVTGALPRLEERLNWLKVDVAAQAVVQVALSKDLSIDTSDCPVYHIINWNTTPAWSTMLKWIGQYDNSIAILEPAEWVDRLEDVGLSGRDHPARKLLNLWKGAYSNHDGEAVGEKPSFEMGKTTQAAPILKDLRPVDEAFFSKIWQWIRQEM